MPLWLLALLFTAFVVHTDDHVIAGLLPEIAADLGVSEAAAGQLVTVFSLTVVAQRGAEPYWSFGLSVSCEWLDEEEYLDISRSVDGEWTTVEVRSSE